jgi:hypothetical protein
LATLFLPSHQLLEAAFGTLHLFVVFSQAISLFLIASIALAYFLPMDDFLL